MQANPEQSPAGSAEPLAFPAPAREAGLAGGVLTSYAIVFLASGCTLVLEIIAGRILAPFIGVSLYTWTSIIGVCLAGISVGNFLGGAIADRLGSRRTLGIILLAGGLSSLIILPLVSPEVDVTRVFPRERALEMTFLSREFWLVARIVVITSVLFLPPTLILGMVSPVVVKLTLTDLNRAGGVVGKIYAFSTLGSIVGTFLAGFVLISNFGVRSIVLGVGALLLVMAVMFGDFFRRKASNAVIGGIAAACFVIILAFIRDYDAMRSPCYKETNYYCIKVTDHIVSSERLVKTLVLDHLIHSYNSLEDPTYLVYGYIKVYAELSEYIAQTHPDFSSFFLGGGAYTLPRQIEALRPNNNIEVAEIDPGVTLTNFERMGLDPRTRIITHNMDAREVVEQKQGKQKYDLVIGDAFNDLQIPYHLTTLEFTRKIRGMLKDDGMYLVLVIDRLRGGQFIPAFVKTMQQVFPHVYVTADGNPWNSPFPNTYVVASSPTQIDFEKLKTLKGQGTNGQSVTGVMPKADFDAWLAESERLGRAVILTDDFAPADNLVAPLFVERGF
ncbi:MAG: fused MFS/spermidine synthase [Chloroflexota bacterium]